MIKSLQSLRVAGTLMIFVHHFGFSGDVAASFGDFAVCLFMMLSGFVLCVAYAPRIDAGKRWSTLDFMRHRLVRIYPLYLIAFLVMCTLEKFHISFFTAVADLLMLQSLVPDSAIFFSANSPAWFVSAIMLLYALFPFLLRQMRMHPIGFRMTVGVYFAIYAIIAMVVPNELVKAVIYINPLMQLSAFLLGMLLWQLYNKLHTMRYGAYCILPALLTAVVAVWLFPYVPQRVALGSLWWIPSAALILTFALTDHRASLSILRSRQILLLADISFTFYIFHYPCLRLMEIVMHKLSVTISEPFVQFTVALSCTILVALAVNKLLEKPIARSLDTFILKLINIK